MQYQSAVALLSLAASAIAAPHTHEHRAPLEVRQTPIRGCSHTTGGVHFIGVPGAGSTNPPYGLLDTLRMSVMSAIPGSSNVSMPYDHTNPNGLQQSADGTNTLHTYIQQYHSACPSTKIVIAGYSSGGIMGMNTFCGEGPQYSPAVPALDGATYGPTVVALVTYGEETRSAGHPYDVGTCTGYSSHARAAPSNECLKGWAARIKNYCDKTDPFCCTSQAKYNAKNNATHYIYPKYDKVATQFIVSQVNAHGGA